MNVAKRYDYREETASRCATIVSMRSIARMGMAMALLAACSTAAARGQFTLPGGVPGSIRDVVNAVRGPIAGEDPDEKRHIPVYLEGAQCGGWDKDIGVNPYIANVWGLPGRYHDWSGDIRSGMGTRFDSNGNDDLDDDYDFPDSAQGLSTACEKGKSSDWKEVWFYAGDIDTMDGPVATYDREWREYAYPYFEDPPCQWRIQTGNWPPVPLNPWEQFEYDKGGWETEDIDSCIDFCGYLNDFVYHDCLEPEEKDVRISEGWFDDDGNEVWHWERINGCNKEGEKYVCTDANVDWDNHGQSCFLAQDDMEEWANSRKCEGEGCRCPSEENPDACWWVRDADDGKLEYQSYYRLYAEAGFSRDGLWDHVQRDDSSRDFETTCFGFYNEFDPKKEKTAAEDRRCVINIDVENMHETQLGKGEYKESNVQDRDPTDEANQRPGGPDDIPGVFGSGTDIWYKKLGTAFSFVNEILFKKDYDGDLGNVFLAYDELDDGAQIATPQINPNDLFAESNLMRAFDDTGNPRAYVRWWQEQETRMAALMRPPVLRIVLPSAWFIGLDPNDPFLTSTSGAEDSIRRADRSDRIELQVEADEDTLGTALAYLERSVLLHVEEEPIPIVVPMGSPAEFRARAADWCAWYKEENNSKNCDDAPEDVKKLIERLEEYANRIDDYRGLRAELAQTAGAALELQRSLLEPIASWFKDNEGKLRAIVRGRERVERELVPLWRQAQQRVALLHEKSNLPWCMNQRFTSPIYSLLDDWLPSRDNEGDPDGDGESDVFNNELGLPLLPLVERPEDVIIDFSAVTAMSGTLKLPVLKPIQIRIDVPSPPAVEEMPELPSIDGIHQAIQDAIGSMPEVRDRLEDPELMDPPPPLSDDVIGKAGEALGRIGEVARNLNERYEKFWKAIGPLRPLDPEAPDYEDQLKLKQDKEAMRCKDFDTMPCEHVEMDLLERAQRIGSRPLVQLYDDFLSVGTPRTEPTVCLPEDDACHILNAERADPGFRWEVKGSRANDAPIDELKTTVLRLTQPPPIGDVDPRLLQPYDDDPSPMRSFPAIRLLP